MRPKQNPFHLLFAYVFYIVICSCLILMSAGFVEAILEESPAGGGWLQLDDEHDFVGTVEEWFPKEEFEELTAEAWIYIDEGPDPETYWSVIGQEGRFSLVIHSYLAGGLGAEVRAKNARCAAGAIVREIPKKTWVHVVAFCNAGAGLGLNGSVFVGAPGGHLLKSDKTLRIGGLMPKDTKTANFGENVRLRGYVDEVRISSVLRYSLPGYQVPKGRFEVDEDTLCLWNFDEGPGSDRYEDSSGNGYHLWRGALAVQARNKLSTTWGRLKE